MLELQNINKIFGQFTPNENHALKNINLKINQGDFITIIGSNGAGKSTLYNIIAGTYAPTNGEIFLLGDPPHALRKITKQPEYKRAKFIGRIFQNPLLGTAGKLSLEDNMLLASYKGIRSLKINLNDKKREEFRERISVLGMNLEHRLKDNVELFSGGQRQALTLLMAVMSNPQILLLDEHTAALDPSNAAKVMELTEKFAREYNLTVLMITHNIHQAIASGNRLLMMDGGEIIIDIPKEKKEKLSVGDLLNWFKEIKHKDLDNDRILLG
ncbi:ABC transporter ATP-binding protein [Fibrobacterales bacterium]|nr:ABC transporter ATP-binding protein [Fibrobacterales bacterium]